MITSGVMRLRFVPLFIVGLLLVCACSDQNKPAKIPSSEGAQNQVVLFLNGAERQAESAAQEKEILKALDDLRTLRPEELRERRYADYGLAPNQWTLAQLLRKYFVSSPLRTIDEEALYRDAQDPKAREVIEEQINAIREQRQSVPKS